MRLFPIISVAMRVAVMAKPTPDNWDMSFSSDSDPFSSDSDPFGDPFDFAPKVEEEAKTDQEDILDETVIPEIHNPQEESEDEFLNFDLGIGYIKLFTDYNMFETTTSEPTTADDFTTEIASETTEMIDTTQAEVIEPEVVTTPKPSPTTKATTTTTSTTTTTTTSEKIITTTSLATTTTTKTTTPVSSTQGDVEVEEKSQDENDQDQDASKETDLGFLINELESNSSSFATCSAVTLLFLALIN